MQYKMSSIHGLNDSDPYCSTISSCKPPTCLACPRQTLETVDREHLLQTAAGAWGWSAICSCLQAAAQRLSKMQSQHSCTAAHDCAETDLHSSNTDAGARYWPAA